MAAFDLRSLKEGKKNHSHTGKVGKRESVSDKLLPNASPCLDACLADGTQRLDVM